MKSGHKPLPLASSVLIHAAWAALRNWGTHKVPNALPQIPPNVTANGWPRRVVLVRQQTPRRLCGCPVLSFAAEGGAGRLGSVGCKRASPMLQPRPIGRGRASLRSENFLGEEGFYEAGLKNRP